eukprot:14110522-Alexandrium_andersonii.AAC.1
MLREQSPPLTADYVGEIQGSINGPRTAARVAPTSRRQQEGIWRGRRAPGVSAPCLLYTSDAADDM